MARVVVGIDQSEHSRAALEWAAAEARKQQAELIVVHAWSVPARAYGVGSSVLTQIPGLDQWAFFEQSARAAVDDLLASVDVDDVEVSVRLVPGHAGQALVEIGRDADMIVVGSRGRGALAQLVLGSTTRYVSRNATVPVVVIPRVAAKETAIAA